MARRANRATLAMSCKRTKEEDQMNIAARAGRWSAAHSKTATFGWLALVICAVAVGKLAGTVALTDSEQSTGESPGRRPC